MGIILKEFVTNWDKNRIETGLIGGSDGGIGENTTIFLTNQEITYKVVA